MHHFWSPRWYHSMPESRVGNYRWVENTTVLWWATAGSANAASPHARVKEVVCLHAQKYISKYMRKSKQRNFLCRIYYIIAQFSSWNYLHYYLAGSTTYVDVMQKNTETLNDHFVTDTSLGLNKICKKNVALLRVQILSAF